MARNLGPRTLLLHFKKDTAGTYVYAEQENDEGTPLVLRSVYIAKWAMTSEPPQKISITITPLDD
jgi:hypothetical protein